MKRLAIEDRFYKFLIIGVLNTIVGYSLYALFIYLGFSYPIAVLFATVLGVLFNFKTIGRVVFGDKGNSRLFQFIAVYTLIYILNVLGLWGLEYFSIDNKYIAGAILIVPLALLSFFLNKVYVFKGVV